MLGVAANSIVGMVEAPIITPYVRGMSRSELFTLMTSGMATISGTMLVLYASILNEFIAYLQMAGLPQGTLSPRSVTIMTYAMCGFANLGSLGILIGGLNALAPERKHDIVSLGMKSIMAGTLATCMTGAVAGLLC
ncbi:hypothetical protein DSM101010T_11450 [Desulfovibrio subterraneus]|uniref:Concentrative nucleoside transporter C-terminal domain-containing protein n=2 Tax=Desulfovibrio subterraneus TaxID=2718620 RepID=A0A7J0BGF5_9BACT|nr:hypothetical protein DSM101010T_11450 [Desulfovibrio subterraneus]